MMRGRQTQQPSIFVQATVESFVPEEHPLRRIKELADEALKTVSKELGRGYAKTGRPSIPPERLLKSMLLIGLYSVHSERSFCEQLNYNLLFKWFVGLELDERAFSPTSFTKNRERFMKESVGKRLFDAVVGQASDLGLLSSEHFSVDGTLIEAAASMKSFKPKDDDHDHDHDSNGWADFSGTKRSNDTHASKTDPDARLMRKGHGKEAKLSYAVNVMTENRNGLIVEIEAAVATGTTEREGALRMVDAGRFPRKRESTLGADKGYDALPFITELKARGIRPHVAMTDHSRRRKPPLDKRTTNSRSYAVSQIKRRLVEGVIGWIKHPGRLRRARFRGLRKTSFFAQIIGAAHNLLRMSRLAFAPT